MDALEMANLMRKINFSVQQAEGLNALGTASPQRLPGAVQSAIPDPKTVDL
jgi:hypothetical protein